MKAKPSAGPPRRWRELLLNLFLLAAALLPRALSLDAFATADEAKWVYRSAQFLGALLRGDLAGTIVNLTPAVTTTWLGALGLTAYHVSRSATMNVSLADWLAALPEFRAELEVLVAVRWPMVMLTTVGLVALYQLARRLVGRRVALIAALLLACDPQSIALSRILGHDAPAGLFVGWSLLAFLIAWKETAPRYQRPVQDQALAHAPPGQTAAAASWGWIVLSGLAAGLAFLSKSPTFFLVPFVGLVMLVSWLRRQCSLRHGLAHLVLWGAAAWLVFVLLWPAAWRDPLGTPYAVVHNAFLSATDRVEAEAESYWLVPDLGPFYYPINGAFKLSALASLGLLAWLVLSGVQRRRPMPWEVWLWTFVLLFTLFMTLGGKRSNRYLLPAWPPLYMLAASGLDWMAGYASRWAAGGARLVRYLGWGALGAVLIAPLVWSYPYYLTYFNPWLGGPLTAPHLVKIGWGEGLDQVGHWLNSQSEATALRVGSDYASALTPFFAGKVSHTTADGLDYVVVYRKQLQEGEPSPGILRYYQAMAAAYTVRLAGIDYAYVYPGPAMQPALANQAAFDLGILPKPLAFRLSRPYLPLGEALTVEVLWLADVRLPVQPSWLTLQPASDLLQPPGARSGQVWAEAAGQLERWAPDLVVSRHQLTVPAELPRASYGLLVDGRPLGETAARRLAIPPLDAALNVTFGDQLRLLGYIWDESAARLELAWQAAPRAWADYTFFVHVVNDLDQRVAGVDSRPLVPTSSWVRHEVMSMVYAPDSPYGALLPTHLPAGAYRLAAGVYRSDNGQRLPAVDADGTSIGDSLLLPPRITIKAAE